MIQVRQGGLLSLIQDRGRPGLRHLGIPASGALVPAWMHAANVLVGNAPDTPVIECHEGGLQLQVSEEIAVVAMAGDVTATSVSETGQTRALEPWQSHAIAPGSTVNISSSGQYRLVVLAIAGFAPRLQFDSASTYRRATLGGLNGHELRSGDELPLSALEHRVAGLCCAPLLPQDEFRPAAGNDVVSLAAVPGPQFDAFSEQAQHAFFEDEFVLTREADRMGARLEGTELTHRSVAHRDIVSDAIVPGSVQVPGSGQPIVLLADAHTAGGYPKIATVVSSDLERLALYRAGQRYRFRKLDSSAAVARVRQHHHRVQKHCQQLRRADDVGIDAGLLMRHNLITGVVDAKA